MTKKLNKEATNVSGVRANISYGNMLDQERYISILNDVKNATVLDCACGVGWGSYLIANAGAKHTVSVDLSYSAIKSAKQFYNHEKIDYINADIIELSLDYKFDVITSFETIEHLENPQEFLKILKKYSNDQTTLYLSTPNGNIFKSRNIPENPFHVDEYSKNQLALLFDNAGWSIKEYLGQYLMHKNDKIKIEQYKVFIKKFWSDKKLTDKYGVGYQLFGKIYRRVTNQILQDPAHQESCRPVRVNNDHEPAYHFFKLMLK